MLFGLLPVALHAQTDRGIETQEDALRMIQGMEEGRHAEAEASRYQKIKGGPVSLAEVMRDPDNIELNYRYAQTQVADGNLRGAGATLERILMINPELSNIRLFYTNVLYRLDNITEAQTQLAILQEKELSPANRKRVAQLQAGIERRQRRTTYTASIGFGVTYQDNANFAPDGESIDVLVETPFGPIQITDLETPDTEREDDFALVATAGFGFKHDLGYQRRHEAFGSLNMVWNEQDEVDSTDYTSVSGNLGATWRSDYGDITGRVLLGQFNLDDDDSFLVTSGAEVGLQRKYYNEKMTMNARYLALYEDYDSADGFSSERTGIRHELEVGARYLFAHNQRLGGSIQYTNKEADEDWQEFDGWEVAVDHVWLMGRGRYLKNQLSYGNEEYSDSNPRISTKTRDDDELRYRLAYSSPLREMIDRSLMPKWFHDVRFNASLQYTDVSSNIRNYDYDNTKVGVFLTKAFKY
jgi:hypothetical protein